jgi:hypothetical protein
MEWFDRLLARREEVIRLFATKPGLGAGKVYYGLVCSVGGANMLRKTVYELMDQIGVWRNCAVVGNGRIRRLEYSAIGISSVDFVDCIDVCDGGR